MDTNELTAALIDHVLCPPPREGHTVYEPELRTAREACHSVDLPTTFVLIGLGGPQVIETEGAQAPYVVDAEGAVLRSGAVYVWCHTGCCRDIPRRWPSVDAAANYHGSIIVEAGGRARIPEPPNERRVRNTGTRSTT